MLSLWVQHLDCEIDKTDSRQIYLEEIKLGINSFAKMLYSLKEHYKIPVLDLENIDLNILLEEIILSVKTNIIENGIEILTGYYPDLPLIEGDQEKLKSVIMNLIFNAAEAIENEGRIEIETDFSRKTSEIVLRIKDNGKGIEKYDLERIFYPFYSTKSAGSGLGLAISLNIIAAHKGDIKVESEFGKGASFTVSFPQKES